MNFHNVHFHNYTCVAYIHIKKQNVASMVKSSLCSLLDTHTHTLFPRTATKALWVIVFLIRPYNMDKS